MKTIHVTGLLYVNKDFQVPESWNADEIEDFLDYQFKDNIEACKETDLDWFETS